MRRTVKESDGFTLVEVMAAMLVLLAGTLGVLLMFDQANQSTVQNRARERATAVVRELIEVARGLSYDSITASTLPELLKAQPGLADADPATAAYEIKRRNIVYTITTSACIMDDARDGGGDQSTGGFCAESVAPNTKVGGRVDRNPEDYKRVSVTATWRLGRTDRSVTQTVLINNPGAAGGPSVQGLTLQGFTSPPPVLTKANVPSGKVIVAFTTSSKPASVGWYVDSKPQTLVPTAGSSGQDFTVLWDFSNLIDGPYVIAAEAYDKWGVAGPGRSLSVTVNRELARKPEGLIGGRNKGVVELEWKANIERDIVGYEVWRRNAAGTDVRVCSLSDATSCTDPSPVAGVLDYWVLPFDTDPSTGAPRPGVASDMLRVTEDNRAPFPAQGLNAVRNPDGTVTLAWSRPSPEDPDSADGIIFYRIYRDGARYGRRYVTGPTETWTDQDTGGVRHRYQVVAVDNRFMESDGVEVEL